MTRKPWRHSARDGRGKREVFVDGVKSVKGTVYADTRRGFVIETGEVLQLNRRRDAVRVFRRYGRVEVNFV